MSGFAANTRAQKRSLAYDGHNRHSRQAAVIRAMKWRRWRRETQRWLREVMT